VLRERGVNASADCGGVEVGGSQELPVSAADVASALVSAIRGWLIFGRDE
jgi:hypothetical protein